jgi:hypothetical protein
VRRARLVVRRLYWSTSAPAPESPPPASRAGHAFKRNELGRVDPKDDIAALDVREADGSIELTR